MAEQKRKRYRLPNGDVLDNAQIYLDEWHRLAAPIEEITGWRLFAFDPDFAFDRAPAPKSESVSVEMALIIYHLVRGAPYDVGRRQRT